jgi:hypothetical protein
MTTNRRPLDRRSKIGGGVSVRAVELFKLCLQLEEEGNIEKWEEEGGTRRAALNAHEALHIELGLKPWEPSPVDAWREKPPSYMTAPHQVEMWARVYALRRALEAAVA